MELKLDLNILYKKTMVNEMKKKTKILLIKEGALFLFIFSIIGMDIMSSWFRLLLWIPLWFFLDIHYSFKFNEKNNIWKWVFRVE